MQTKIDKAGKKNVREMIDSFKISKGRIFCFPRVGLTLAMIPAFEGSRMTYVGTSFASPTETKFRKLVGAELAIYSCWREVFQVPVNPEHFQEWATAFATSVWNYSLTHFSSSQITSFEL